MYIKGHLCDKHMCMIMLMWLCYSFTPIHVCFFVLFPSLPSFPVVHGSLQRNLEITNERTNGRMLLRFQAKLCHVVVCLSVCVSHTLCVQCNERKKVHSSLCLCLCLFVCLMIARFNMPWCEKDHKVNILKILVPWCGCVFQLGQNQDMIWLNNCVLI